jgi:hypothetical protein
VWYLAKHKDNFTLAVVVLAIIHIGLRHCTSGFGYGVDRDQWWAPVNMVINVWFLHKGRKILSS